MNKIKEIRELRGLDRKDLAPKIPITVAMLGCLENGTRSLTEKYINKVVELANDTERLKILHSTLREKMLDTPLANSLKFTKSLENGFIDMSNKYNNKKIQ